MTASVHRNDQEGIALLVIDCPGRTMNVMDDEVLGELAVHFQDIAIDDSLTGIVVCSGKEGSFGAGADIAWLPTLAASSDRADVLARIHELKIMIANSNKPVVTAVTGPALGGALELALTGHEILATADAALGLPEVTLELIPGGGGTQTLFRWLSIPDGLALLTSGKALSAVEALENGLVSRICEDAVLLDEAMACVRELHGQPLRPVEPRHADAALGELDRFEQQLRESGRPVSPAVEKLLAVVRTGVDHGVEAGLAAERLAFLDLLDSAPARAAIHLFRAQREVRRIGGEGPVELHGLGVIGAGQMGAGIAATAVTKGLTAVVRDVDEDALGRARTYLERVMERTGQGTTEAWSGVTGWDGFSDVDAVIEAVFELPELKSDILSAVSERVGADVLVATNTSAIPIRTLATAVDRPERFLGMHFFSPVERMPLVELIPHAGTSQKTVHRAAALGRRLGKTPVVVGDAPGFFTSRVYARWLIEGVRLLLDGVTVERVDEAARSAGFPVGPLQAHDEATLDLVVNASLTQVADPVMADRLDVEAVRRVLESMIERGANGRRHGAGFYRYRDGKRDGANPMAGDALADDVEDRGLTDELIGRRLLLAFVTECFLCWDDATLCHPDDGDVASVLGIGFPRSLGGPFHWSDETGHDAVAEWCLGLGREFPVGDWLGKQSFKTAPRRTAPFTSV